MTDYSQTATAGQSVAEPNCYLRIPSYLPGFIYGNYSEPPHFNKAIPLLRSKPDIVINI